MIMIIMKSGICRAFVPDTGCGVTQWFAFGGEMAASMSDRINDRDRSGNGL